MSEDQKTPAEIAAEAAIAAKEAKAADKAELEGPLTELKQLTVLVVRDPMAQVPTQIFEHELPILFHLFGEDGVQVDDSKTRMVEVANFNVDSEFERLQRKYKHNNAGSVYSVYGESPRQLAEELGLRSEARSRGANRHRQEQQNVAVDHNDPDANDLAAAPARIVPLKRVASKPAPGPAKATKRNETAKAASPKAKTPAKKSAK